MPISNAFALKIALRRHHTLSHPFHHFEELYVALCVFWCTTASFIAISTSHTQSTHTFVTHPSTAASQWFFNSSQFIFDTLAIANLVSPHSTRFALNYRLPTSTTPPRLEYGSLWIACPPMHIIGFVYLIPTILFFCACICCFVLDNTYYMAFVFVG